MRRRRWARDGEAGPAREAPSPVSSKRAARCTRAPSARQRRPSLSRRGDKLSLGSRPAARSLSRSRSRSRLCADDDSRNVESNRSPFATRRPPVPPCRALDRGGQGRPPGAHAAVSPPTAPPPLQLLPAPSASSSLELLLGAELKGGKESARRDEEERRGEDDNDAPATSGRTSACGSWSRAATKVKSRRGERKIVGRSKKEGARRR